MMIERFRKRFDSWWNGKITQTRSAVIATIAIWCFVSVAFGAVYGIMKMNQLVVYDSAVFGDGTAKDWCVTFDDDDMDKTLCWDESEDSLSSNAVFKVTSGTAEVNGVPSPGFVFNSSSSANAGSEGSFLVSMLDTTAADEESAFDISVLGNGSGITPVRIAGDSSNGAYIKWYAASSPGIDAYTGTTGYRTFLNSRKYQFDNDIYNSKTSGALYLEDSGGSCYKCIIDTSESSNFKCTSATCPS